MKPFLFAFSLLFPVFAWSQAVKVEVRQNNGTWELVRENNPYYIKGAGGHTQMDKLVELGGNCVRTWSTDNAREILDEAQSKGLTVMMGLWVQHERHGFDYNNKGKVAAQLDGFRKVVSELKDHPALLLWGVGNEVDLFYTNTAVWYAVEDIAKMIHEVDPNHPTCTVTAGLDGEEVKLIKERAPSIDIYGINTYGDIGNVPANIRKFGWTGPYLITEWGPNGHWEVTKTNWSAPIEQSSSEKAISYRDRYSKYIASDKEMCMGSFVFLWGHKQETTATWYGLFSETGDASEACDELYKAWKGSTPKNSASQIDSLLINGQNKFSNVTLVAEEKYPASVLAKDIDGDNLDIEWMIIPESTDIKAGGDAEAAPIAITGLFVKRKGSDAVFRAPVAQGSYRLFVFIKDGNGHYAYDNLPFKVIARDPAMGPGRGVSFKHLSMNE
jgi:hypothetical protein